MWTLAKNVAASGQPASYVYNPLSFSPQQMPGFSDYQAVYSKFRIIMAKVEIATALSNGGIDAQPLNYLIVGSRPFAETNVPVPNPELQTPLYYVPAKVENDLRQARWQKVRYPSAITRKVTAKFKPYTMIATYGPSSSSGQVAWQRPWEGTKWTPFTWASSDTSTVLLYYGPYCVVSTNTVGDETITPVTDVKVTLTCWFKFSGQK